MNGRRGTYTDRVEDTRAALVGDPDADAEESPTLDVGADDDDPIERSRRKRRNRKVLVVALVLLLVPVLAVGGYLVWLNQIVSHNIKQEMLLPDTSPPVDANGQAVPQVTGSGTNYLIIGNDAGPDRQGARSDVMVLVHVPADHRDVTLIHFPRDLWVPIPGKGEAKLNASYAWGGAPLLVRTMQNMLGVKIDHVAMLGFEGFKNMTDAVGGVRVYAEEASNGSGNGGPVVIKKGWNDLNGEQALGFVRERYQLSQGDISRGHRQLAFIKALMLKAISPATVANPLTIAKFTDAATKNLVLDQDLSVSQLRDYAVSLRDIRGGDVVFSTAPFTGFGTSPAGASIDVVDKKGMAELGAALRTDSREDYTDVFVTP